MPRVTEPGRAEILISSYGKKFPRQMRAQYEVDVTNFRDPLGQKSMRNLTGIHMTVRQFIRDDDRFKPLIETLWMQTRDQLGSQRSTYISFGIMDFHGSHTAVAVAEELADQLSTAGYSVEVKHLNLGGGK